MRRPERRVRLRTTKLMDRLSYSPNKHRDKKRKKMRAALQAKNPSTDKTPSSKTSLKFVSFNVNGLDLDSGWAVQQLLVDRDFDVSKSITHFT